MARLPFKAERLTLDVQWRMVSALRRRSCDGTSAVVLKPLEFIARLSALVP